jgi:ATP-dependent helicase/nuclease subunit A
MSRELAERVVDSFGLTGIQKQAALERDRDVVVTAGAGSGKTRTLVARYVSLLAEGLEPRRVVAITFTKKAAREMRSRVRDAMNKLVQDTESLEEQVRWLTLASRMDAARIGTIHSICTEILQAHPAEAGIDPRFGVLDEGLTAALRAQVVEDTLGELVDDPTFTTLFALLTPADLGSMLQFLLDHRLEAAEAFAERRDVSQVVLAFLESTLCCEELVGAITDLKSRSHADLEADGLVDMVLGVLAQWGSAETALNQGDLVTCAGSLIQARKLIKLNVGKRVSPTKDILTDLRNAFETLLVPVLGDEPPDPDAEAHLLTLMTLVSRAFEPLNNNYRAALAQRQALDFDDLEAGAEKLLGNETIRARWQAELDALLVDEFQDTNIRQRTIVEALAGVKGHLFVVGDARQSIYRFRRADVTVFRDIEQRVKSEGGLPLNLDRTYRAHEPLLAATGELLKGIMGEHDDPSRPYYVPFSQLDAYRKTAPKYIQSPHIELVIGAGEDAASARPVMAMALGKRLLELKGEGQVRAWDDVALLFRASSGFAYYENAFEDLGIPFVTVAGRGFYERPEIRDVLNILRALSDPGDDLATAGLLRSPAFGLSDAGLYMLRQQGDQTLSYWRALQGDVSMLNEADQTRARRALEILSKLIPQVDRIPVAELLKQLVDETDYRAILASKGESRVGGRLWRNLDKLLADAQASGQVNVRDFLDYLATLSDAGAREGEAPADAQGAVSLMTIHKSKGLEFPVVVLADASKEKRSVGELAYLLPETGLALKLAPAPLLYCLAKHQNGLQEESESVRILYVALTRAKEKLIISGHMTPTKKGEWKSAEWMGEIAAEAQVDLNALADHVGVPLFTQTQSGQPVRAIAFQEVQADAWVFDGITSELPNVSAPLYQPLGEPQTVMETNDELGELRPWRATGESAYVPPGVIGQMVHKAIELWLFSDDAKLRPILETLTLNAGLASEKQRVAAVRRTLELLGRLRTHPLWDEIASATERHHEVSYSRMVGERAETGYIDLLYRNVDGWQVVDFKTDSIQSANERDERIALYSRQMSRYSGAVEMLLGQPVHVRICFLDDNERVGVVEV